jgi:hypothetical protein
MHVMSVEVLVKGDGCGAVIFAADLDEGGQA